jgi:hypothetical protein
MARNLSTRPYHMRYLLSPKFSMPAQHSIRDGRRKVLIVLMLLITAITVFQLGIYVGIIEFHLAYVVPPFAALIATFICALINILFHRFFERHHLRLLYLTTSLPFLFFATAILTHFFEEPIYNVIAFVIAFCSIIWYITLLRMMSSTSTVEE